MTGPGGGESTPTVVLAPAGPALPELVAAFLGGGVDQAVVQATAAANAVAKRWGRQYGWAPADGQAWADDKVQGTVMVAARFYRRRDSPAGLLPFGGDGGAAYVAKTDPDAALLLEIGPYAPPGAVG